MSTGSAGYSSLQPAQYIPGMQNVAPPVRTWATTGNTDTVIDASIHPTSVIAITFTSARNGTWYDVIASQGQFVVTSSDSETAGLTYNYRVL